MPEDKKVKKPIYKKWWFWLIIIVGTLFIISGFIGRNAQKIGSSESSLSQENEKQYTSSEFKVGDVISFDDKEVTVTNVKRNYHTGNEYEKPVDGNEFVKVTVKIKNKSKNDVSYNVYDFKIKNGNGVLQTAKAETYSLSDSLSSGQIAHNGTVNGSMIFEVPKGDKNLTLKYSPSFWSNRNIEIKL